MKTRLVRRGKKGLWTVVVSLPGNQQRYLATGTADEAQAKRRQREIERELDAGIRFDENPTVSEWLQRWFDDFVAPRRTPTTLVQYKHHMRRIVPVIGKVRLRDLRPSHISALHTHLLAHGRHDGGPLDPKSVTVAHGMLVAALHAAMRQEILYRNVASLVSPPSVPYREQAFLTEEECARLVAASPDSPWRAYAVLDLLTGLRRGELIGLHWEDIDWDRGTVRIVRQRQRLTGGTVERDPKTKRSRRTLALPETAIGLLRNMRSAQDLASAAMGIEPATHVFAHIWHGKWAPYTPDAATWGVKQLYIQAELPVPARPVHTLRHTVGTLLRMLGADQRLAQEQLGHTSGAMTAEYQHVPTAEQRAAVEKLARKIGGEQK